MLGMMQQRKVLTCAVSREALLLRDNGLEPIPITSAGNGPLLPFPRAEWPCQRGEEPGSTSFSKSEALAHIMQD